MRTGIAARLVLMLATVASGAAAQQVPDPDFRFANPNPMHAAGKGPVVCIDEAHQNFHTAGGRYASFADLLRGDGHVVQPFAQKFSREALKPCAVLVIANAIGAENSGDWSYPHASAFSRAELNELYLWIRDGGALLLIADHSPMPGASADLGALLGVAMIDGYVEFRDGGEVPDLFRASDGGLAPHAITAGRGPQEALTEVGTFRGSAFTFSEDYQPLLVLPQSAVNVFHLSQSLKDQAPPRSEWPRFSVAGWSQGATRLLGKGRVLILGEAAMCSAQLSGTERFPMGMNHPKVAQNPQFCLNVVRWLTGALDSPKTTPNEN